MSGNVIQTAPAIMIHVTVDGYGRSTKMANRSPIPSLMRFANGNRKDVRLRASKFESVVALLRPLPPSDLSYQERVIAVKNEILAGRVPLDAKRYNSLLGLLHEGLDEAPVSGVEGLASEYARLRDLQDHIKNLSSLITLRVNACEQMLAASQDAKEEGWGRYGVAHNAVRLPDGSTIRVQKEPYGKVVDKDAFRQWCVANGYGEQLQLWPSTMNTLVKERLMAGEEPPDGTEAFSYVKIVYTSSKEK